MKRSHSTERCPICGERFRKKQHSQVICGDIDCRRAYYQRKLRVAVSVRCPQCGEKREVAKSYAKRAEKTVCAKCGIENARAALKIKREEEAEMLGPEAPEPNRICKGCGAKTWNYRYCDECKATRFDRGDYNELESAEVHLCGGGVRV